MAPSVNAANMPGTSATKPEYAQDVIYPEAGTSVNAPISTLGMASAARKGGKIISGNRPDRSGIIGRSALSDPTVPLRPTQQAQLDATARLRGNAALGIRAGGRSANFDSGLRLTAAGRRGYSQLSGIDPTDQFRTVTDAFGDRQVPVNYRDPRDSATGKLRAKVTQFATSVKNVQSRVSTSLGNVADSVSRAYTTNVNQGYQRLQPTPQFDMDETIRPDLIREVQPFEIETQDNVRRSRTLRNTMRQYQPLSTNVGRPNTLSERLVKFGTLNAAKYASTGTGVGAGLLGGYLGSKIMTNQDPYATAFVSGMTGEAASRFAAYGTQSLVKVSQKGVQRGVATSLAKNLTLRSVRAGMTSFGLGVLKGGAAGLVAGGFDVLLNQAFLGAGASHADAGAAASSITTLGVMGGVGLYGVAVGAAPATLGLSLAAAAAIGTIGTVVSWITGYNEDQERYKQQVAQANKKKRLINQNASMRKIVSLMPEVGYDFDKAYTLFKNRYSRDIFTYGAKDTIDENSEEFLTFKKQVQDMFSDTSVSQGELEGATQPTPEQTKINDLYAQYVTHLSIKEICKNQKDCGLDAQDPGALTKEESAFLDSQLGEIWHSEGEVAASMHAAHAEFQHHIMTQAQQQLIDGFNDGKLPEDLPDEIRAHANADGMFLDAFNKYIEYEAQRIIIQDYIESGGENTMENQPTHIQEAAIKDGEFKAKYDTYVSHMNSTAFNMNLTISQVIELQALEPDKQTLQYQQYQFDNAKENVDIVSQAQGLMQEYQSVRELGYYDIDSAILHTDPTKIGEWRPTDSMIIRASNAGMTMGQYVTYLEELAKGDEGDFSKVEQNEKLLKMEGAADFRVLQDNLQLAGYSPDYYLYDPKTRTYQLNPHAETAPDPKLAAAYESQFTPEYLLEAREEYAKMVTHMNHTNKTNIDEYNKYLASHLHSQALTYQAQVEPLNIMIAQQATAAFTPLLTLDTASAYNANAMQYHPMSTSKRKLEEGDPIVDQRAKHLLGEAIDEHRERQTIGLCRH